MVATDNAIYISDKAKAKVINLMKDAGLGDDPSYFLRVGVVGGGCSGLSYKIQWTRLLKIKGSRSLLTLKVSYTLSIQSLNSAMD